MGQDHLNFYVLFDMLVTYKPNLLILVEPKVSSVKETRIF